MFVQLWRWLKSYPSHFSHLNRGFHDGRTDSVACFERFMRIWLEGFSEIQKDHNAVFSWRLSQQYQPSSHLALLRLWVVWGLTEEPALSGWIAMLARWLCPLHGSWIIMAAKDTGWEVRSKQLSHTGMAWRFTNSSSLCFSAGRDGSMRFLYHCLSIQWISEGFCSQGWPLNSSAQGFGEKSNLPKTSKGTLCSSSKVIAAEPTWG